MFNDKYQQNIGTPTTSDEVTGHFIFAAGLLAGLVGMALFMFSGSASAMREASIILSAAGVSLMVAGPIVRLPLKRLASTLVGVGLTACAAAIVWFSMVFPQAWSVATGDHSVILLYGAGIAIMAVGGIFVPLLTSRPQATEMMEEQKKEKKKADRSRKSAAAAAQKRRDQEKKADGERSDRRRADAEDDRDRRDRQRLEAAVAADEADEADMAAELAAVRDSQSRFEVYEDKAGDWRWRLRHRNGNILADSGQGYTRAQSAERGLASVRRDVPGATVLHLATGEVTEAGETFQPIAEADSQATFQVYEDDASEWRWRLRHDNDKIIADSGEGYATKAGARRAILALQGTAGPADFLGLDNSAFEVYHDGAGEWRWRLVHRNGNVLADSGQGYTRRHDANRAVTRIQSDPTGLDIEVYEDEAGEHRWRATRGSDIVADSGQGYARESEAHQAADRLQTYAADADAVEIGLAAFEIYEGEDGDHRWRLRHRNGNVLADGGEGFASRSGARDGIVSVKRNAPGAEVADA